MKYCFVLFTALFAITLCTTGQNDLPKLGKIDTADLMLKDCDFDKGASAIKLIDMRNIHYYRNPDNTLKMIAEQRTRIKILKWRGLHRYADVRIPFMDKNNSEKITGIEAYTYTLNDDSSTLVTKVDKSSIYTHRINRSVSEIIISFPDTKIGSVIEYSYTLERENIGYIEDWYFQDEIPVRYSAFKLQAPPELNFREDTFMYASVERTVSLVDERILVDGIPRYIKGVERGYVMRNLPGIYDEPFMTSKKDYLQRISFQLARTNGGRDIRTSWEDVAARLYDDDDFGAVMRKNIPYARKLIADVKQIPDTLERMVKFYNAIRDSLGWGYSYSIYALHGVREAWQSKTGSSGDLNLILINLLRQAGIRATPILVSTRSNGVINTKYPSERQFNTVMAYVTIGNNYYVLDAIDDYSHWQLIPDDVCNSWGLRLIGKTQYEWIELLPRHNYSHQALIEATMDTAGVLKGKATIKDYHYAKTPRNKLWQEESGSYSHEYIDIYTPNLYVTRSLVEPYDKDTLPIEQQLEFTLLPYMAGNYSHFPLNIFSGVATNPFTANERKSEIDFGYHQDYLLNAIYILPQTHTFETKSGITRMIMSDSSIYFQLTKDIRDNMLVVSLSIQFKKSIYLAVQYPALQDFYKKMFGKLSEPIIVRKK